MLARYLLRFDDICHSMNWSVWNKVEAILNAHGIRPMMAVVPDNRDKALEIDQPDKTFWDHVRAWQGRGWTIGMHGYQHRYITPDPGILSLNKFSEFAGLDYDEQFSKLESSMALFRAQGIKPRVWIAPGHSFDRNTVKALKNIGINAISDGYALWPYVDENRVFWVPQQLWRFRSLPFGIWTVCFHINGWQDSDIERFEAALSRYREQLVDFHAVQSEYARRRITVFDRGYASVYGRVLNLRRLIKALI